MNHDEIIINEMPFGVDCCLSQSAYQSALAWANLDMDYQIAMLKMGAGVNASQPSSTPVEAFIPPNLPPTVDEQDPLPDSGAWR